MANERHQYSISRRRRLIDSKPTERGELPLVWVPDRNEWISLELTYGEHVDSVPVTDEEAERFMETGEISSMRTGRQEGMSDDSPEE
jgi:hypothetical protein